MLNRRAFLFLVILSLSATSAALAATSGHATASSAHPVGTPTIEIRPVGGDPSLNLIWAYRTVLGIHLLQVLSDAPEIEGVQDGPDGVDPLGIRPRGIKGLIPKYQEEQPPPTPAQ